MICSHALLQYYKICTRFKRGYEHITIQGIIIIEHNVDCAKNKDSRSQNTKHIKQ